MRAVFFVLVATLATGARGAEPAATPPDEAPGDPAAAKAAFQRGTSAYSLGDFKTALAAYEEAYAAQPLPEILFNIGQCHLNLADYDRAVFFYERYLVEKKDASNRELVERVIADAKARLAEEKKREYDELAARRASEEKAANAERARLLEESRLAAQRDAEERTRLAEGESDDKSWLIWTGVGAGALVIVAAVATVVAVVLLQPEPVPPSGSLGTIDRRSKP